MMPFKSRPIIACWIMIPGSATAAVTMADDIVR